MKFLKDRKGNTVEWVTVVFLVVAVVGSMIYLIADTTSDQGGLTNDWIAAIPAPTAP